MKKKIIVKTTEELIDLIDETISREGYKCDLNFIDTSEITDMSKLFANSIFNGDISKWNVSHVTNMTSMFFSSSFNGDIGRWNTSKVKDMNCMFFRSWFNGDISRWDTSNVTDMSRMFQYSRFNRDIRNWNTSKVANMNWIFAKSKFSGNVSEWNVEKVNNCYEYFGLDNEEYLPLKFRNPLDQCKSYLGWKKLRDGEICKLLIPEDAIKLKGVGNKCRASKAEVINITDINTNKSKKLGYSMHDPEFVYKVGEEVVPDGFGTVRWNECSNGIHFFLTREEAINY